jgi:hypothetical protein
MGENNFNQETFLTNPKIQTEGTEQLIPDAKGSGEIFSRLGYKLPDAIADLVDNSIDAEAGNILIRFIRTDDQILRVIILDDGRGLEKKSISEAMRVGSSFGKSKASLGKYGIGLKSASLSQANSFSVLSVSNSVGVGRKWTLDNIRKNWLCDVLNGKQIEEYLSHDFGPISLNGSGTMIVWEELQHLRVNANTIEATLNKSIKSLMRDIGLRFHRFISRGQLKVFIDVQSSGMPISGIHFTVSPLDPFSYETSGKEGYPKSFNIELPPYGKLKVETHIWPAKSTEQGYKLGGGKVSSMQGLFIYRNDRLIQTGGWNGCRDDDSEPHLSLARVLVNLPPEFDSTFQLDVTKSKVEPPPEFPSRLMSAEKPDGSSFKKYLNDAQAVYRKQKTREGGNFKHTPGKGFPKDVRERTKSILWQKGSKTLSSVDFAWERLDPDIFFELNLNNNKPTIILNSFYRKKVLQGQAASATDAALIKLLLMFLLHDHLDRKANTEKYLDWIQKINLALVITCNKGL